MCCFVFSYPSMAIAKAIITNCFITFESFKMSRICSCSFPSLCIFVPSSHSPLCFSIISHSNSLSIYFSLSLYLSYYLVNILSIPNCSVKVVESRINKSLRPVKVRLLACGGVYLLTSMYVQIKSI